MGANANNNICIALNYLYGNLLTFENSCDFFKIQKEYIENIKKNLELALPRGKFVTSKLEEFCKMDDPTYNNQSDFFEKNRDYIEEMKIEAEKLKENYKNYKPKDINEKEFFKDSNDYKKYQLVQNYEEVYNMVLLLEDTLDDNQKKSFNEVIKRTLHCYYMAFRMCRKLDEYRKKYPFDGDEGKFWLKDQKMSTMKHHAERFKKINEERFKKKRK